MPGLTETQFTATGPATVGFQTQPLVLAGEGIRTPVPRLRETAFNLSGNSELSLAGT
jgi:hypothetical protein